MIQVRPPLPGELESVGRNAAEQWVRDTFLAGGDFSKLFNRPLTKVMLIDDTPVAAGGFVDQGGGNAIGWTLVGHVPQQQLFALCRKFRREMIATPFLTIECHCFETFQASHRWVQCIGFKPLPGSYSAPDGRAFRRFTFRNDHDGH